MVYRSFQNGSNNVTDIYITDYTDNKLVSQYKPEGLKRRLNGEPVFHIAYFGEPDDVRNLEIGALYKFEEVRVSTQEDGSFKGYTKNADSGIKKIGLRRSSDPDVAEFLKYVIHVHLIDEVNASYRRKESFLSGQIVC